jgi:type IV pilus assembly protein PilM
VNSFRFKHILEPDQAVVLLDLGARGTKLHIYCEGGNFFTRDITFGGNEYTSVLQREFNINLEGAEDKKRNTDISGFMNDSAPAYDAVRRLFKGLVNEIVRSLTYYNTQNKSATLTKVLITGGGSRIPGLRQYLFNEVDLPVEDLNPLKDIIIEKKVIESCRADSHYLATAIGLAARNVDAV